MGRVYDEVAGLIVNSVSIGGVSRIETSQSHRNNVESKGDGDAGAAEVDQAGQIVDFSFATEDALKLIDLLNATPASAEWFGHESGAATYAKGSLVNPVCHSGQFNAALGSYATIAVNGTCKFPNAAATFDDVEGFLGGQSAPTQTYAGRQWQPGDAVHNTLTALHVQSLSFNISPREVLRDCDAGDMGMTAVDLAPWNVVGVELAVRDTTQQTGPPTHDIGTALMKNGVQDLVVPLIGVGSTANKTLTLRNCRFRSKRRTGGNGWTGFALSAVLGWADPNDPWTKRTLNDGTPANRLIDFA